MSKDGCSRKGTINEILVVTDLLKRGWEVYRAVCGGAPCDLVAIACGYVLRVEVTCGMRYAPTGSLSTPRKNPANFDVLAIVVTGEADVIYRPPLPELAHG